MSEERILVVKLRGDEPAVEEAMTRLVQQLEVGLEVPAELGVVQTEYSESLADSDDIDELFRY